jgi:cardiolipin synthase
MLYGQWALRHGIDLTVNWPGRAAVWPVMSALFCALVGLEVLGEVLLYVGIVLAIWATILYIREGSTST